MKFLLALVLAGSLATGIHAFAPIWWMNRVVMPKGFGGSFGGIALPQRLMVANIPDSTSPSKIPYFAVRPDHTITWHDMGLCLEASDDHVAQLNHCTGGAAQKWNWIPDGHGRHRIQLKNSNMCLGVPDAKAQVELQVCENRGLEAWRFEEPITMPMQASSKMRHVMLSLIALAWTGLLGLSTWYWRWQAKSRTATQTHSHNGALINIADSAMANTKGGRSTGCARPPCMLKTLTPAVMQITPSDSKSESPKNSMTTRIKSFFRRVLGSRNGAIAGVFIASVLLKYAIAVLPLMVLLPVLGNITAVLIYSSSCPGLLNDRKQATLTTDPFPYPIALIAALVNCLYGAAINDVFIFMPNFLGVAFSTFNTTTALRLCRDNELAFKLEMILVSGLGLVAATFLTTITPIVFVDAALRTRMLGYLCMATVTLLFGSPVRGALAAARSGDGSQLNMPMTLAMLTDSILWSTYGLMKRDVVIYGRNIAGGILALFTVLVKLSLKLRSKNHTEGSSGENEDEDSSDAP